MSEEDLREERLSGASRKRMQALMKESLDYAESKKAVIKENFTKSLLPKRTREEAGEHSSKAKVEAKKRPTEATEEVKKRPRS